MTTTADRLIGKLRLRKAAIEDVIAGLDGQRFSWGNTQWNNYKATLQAAGVTLLTRSRLKKKGLRLKRGAQPVGQIYFPAPIARYAEVYVAECQAVPTQKEVA